MWVKEDYKGNKVIWYSEEEYKALEEKYYIALKKLNEITTKQLSND